jgi:hypothetical protein
VVDDLGRVLLESLRNDEGESGPFKITAFIPDFVEELLALGLLMSLSVWGIPE